jgi:ribosome-binding protein aMBF1 (putative translation factor)
LGIAQRQIRLSSSHFEKIRRSRKAFPTTVKTLGDFIQAKRFEKGLCQSELAERLGVPISLVRQWEEDQQTPTETQWQSLTSILNLTIPINAMASEKSTMRSSF